MKITYEVDVQTNCPEDGEGDLYKVVLHSTVAILCEDITAAIEDATSRPYQDPPLRPHYQEELTDFLARRLRVRVVSTGWHSGIKTTVDCP